MKCHLWLIFNYTFKESRMMMLKHSIMMVKNTLKRILSSKELFEQIIRGDKVCAEICLLLLEGSRLWPLMAAAGSESGSPLAATSFVVSWR